MRILRGLGGALLWILASLVGLVAVLLCVTLILLPVGIPLLGVARRMWASSVRLMLPRHVAHPIKETGRKGRKKRSAIADDVGAVSKRARKKARSVSKKGGKLTRRQRKKLPV
ncbi:MAG: hypothetical protein ABWY19_14225 [Marmoricola sp.]